MFIIQYFTNPKQTGALCASSSKLAAAMTENIDFQKARNIAEIGAGLERVHLQEIFYQKKMRMQIFSLWKLTKKWQINSHINLKI